MTFNMRVFYDDVVIPFQECITDMQMNGILVDEPKMTALHKQASEKLTEWAAQWQDILGYKFNPNSSQQCEELITKDLQCRMGKPGTSDKLSLLKSMGHEPKLEPIVKAIIDYRQLTKRRGTYLSLKLHNGRSHSDFSARGTVTWRLSSKDPDLQNLPRAPVHGINIKDIYIAPQGYVLLARDFSALEYRIPSYASRCQKLIDIFESGNTPHLRNARVAFQDDSIQKGTEEYTLGKTMKFAEGYGGGPERISDEILKATVKYVSPQFIKTVLDRWRQEYPELYAWYDEGWRMAREEGVLYDGFGYPRPLFSRPDDRRGEGLAWPTAATASGVVNRAMVRYWRGDYRHRFGVRLVLQVHDELVWEVPEEHLWAFNQEIKESMEQEQIVFGIKMKFPTEGKYGPSYGQMKGTGD